MKVTTWANIAGAVLTFVLSAVGTARQIRIGIPRANFEMAYAEQANSNWCWAASIQMIFKYYGIAITQQEIVGRSYGTNPYGQLPNWPGSWQVITANLNNWSVDDKGTRYVVSAQMGTGAPDPRYLLQQVGQLQPVLIAYVTPEGGNHASVVTAVTYTPNGNFPTINTIIFRDPWPSPENKATPGRKQWDAYPLAAHMRRGI